MSISVFDDPSFVAQLDQGVDYSDMQFYLKYEGQADGPRVLPETIDFGNGLGPQLPLLKYFGEEATTTSWVNRGSAGAAGNLTAVGIRSGDLGRDTPFRDATVKGVRCQTEVGTGRYFEAIDALLADVTTEDIFFECVYSREAGTVACPFGKRNQGASTNVGYHLSTAAATTMLWTTRPAGDAVRSGSVTTSQNSFCHVSGYLDNSASGTERQRTYLGSQTSVNAPTATVLGSLSNATPFRVGARWLSSFAAAEDVTIVYLAIWIGNDMILAGSDAALTQIIRNRQMLMGGIAPQVGVKKMLSLSTPFRYVTRSRNGLLKGYRKGAGFEISDDRISFLNGEVVAGIEFASVLNAVGGVSAESYTTAWSAVNCVINNNAIDAPLRPVIAFEGQSLVAASGTNVAKATRTIGLSVSTRYHFGTFAKRGSSRYLYIAVNDSAGNPANRFAYFDLDTGAAVNIGSGLLSARATPFVDGWYKVYVWIDNPAVDAAAVFNVGFSESSSSQNAVGDGSTVNGYLYGVMPVSAPATYINQDMPIIIDQSSTGPIHTYDGASVTSTPYALLWEMAVLDMANSPLVASPCLTLYTDASNYALMSFSSSTTVWRMSCVSVVAGVTQYSLNTDLTTGVRPADGTRNKLVMSNDVNDMSAYSGDNKLVIFDYNTTPFANPAQIRWGQDNNASISGRSHFVISGGVAKSARKTNSHPYRRGVIDGLVAFAPFNEPVTLPRNTVTRADLTTSGSVTFGQAGVEGRAIDLGGGYVETDVAPMSGPWCWAVRAQVLSATLSGNQMIFDQMVPGASTIGNGLVVGINSSFQVYVAYGAGTATSTKTVAPLTTYTFAVVWDQTSISVYVDGALYLSTTAPGTAPMPSSAPVLRLGSNTRSGQSQVASSLRLEKLRVFNYAIRMGALMPLYGRKFAPDLVNPSFWVKSASGNVILDGSNGVIQWTDLSGNGLHAAQPTAGNRPIFGTPAADINGKPTLRFTRANATFLDLGDVLDLGLNSYSMAIVLRRRNDVDGQGIIGKNIAAGTDGRYGLFFSGPTSEYQAIYDQDASASGVVNVPMEPVNTVTAIVDVLTRNTVSVAQSNHDIRMNRVNYPKGIADVATNWNTTAPWVIGRYGASSLYDADVDIAEIIVSLRAWSRDERKWIEDYFAEEWGTP